MGKKKNHININNMEEGTKYTIIFRDSCNVRHQVTGVFNKRWKTDLGMSVQKRIGSKIKNQSICEYIMITKRETPVIIDVDMVISITK